MQIDKLVKLKYYTIVYPVPFFPFFGVIPEHPYILIFNKKKVIKHNKVFGR
ncbi:hypothetical protein ES703_36539 [subsurface metagenome]